jgi:hypothetical protein
MTDDAGDLGILRSFAAWNNESGNRIRVAKIVDVRVVLIVAAGAQHEEISAVGLVAKPAEGVVNVVTTAEERDAEGRAGCDVGRGAEPEVLVGSCRRRRRDEENSDQANGNAKSHGARFYPMRLAGAVTRGG